LRKQNSYCCSFAGLAPDFHVAVHCENHIANDRKAQTNSGIFASSSLIDLKERIEDMTQVLRRDPDASIANPDLHAVTTTLGIY